MGGAQKRRKIQSSSGSAVRRLFYQWKGQSPSALPLPVVDNLYSTNAAKRKGSLSIDFTLRASPSLLKTENVQ